MKCPACKGPLREKGAAGMVVDICYGGCGGLWFDNKELERVDARAATSLHTVWRDPARPVVLTEPRYCPRCSETILEKRWFSETQSVEMDVCPQCSGVWLDEGEFTRVHEEMKGAKTSPPGWAEAIARAAAEFGKG